jgi:hypothetical protein
MDVDVVSIARDETLLGTIHGIYKLNCGVDDPKVMPSQYAQPRLDILSEAKLARFDLPF